MIPNEVSESFGVDTTTEFEVELTEDDILEDFE